MNTLSTLFPGYEERARDRNTQALEKIHKEAIEVSGDYPHLDTQEQYQLALQNVLAEDPVFLNFLSPLGLAELSFRIAPERQSLFSDAISGLTDFFQPESPLDEDADKRLLQQILTEYTGIGYGTISHMHSISKYEYFSALRSDALIEDASVNWESLSNEQKMNVLRRAHEIHSDAFGFESSSVIFGDDDMRSGIADEENIAILKARYNYNYGEITVNPNFLEMSSFEEAIQTLMHEGIHAFDVQLSQNMVAIRQEEETWFEENNIREMPMSEEHFEAYRVHMLNWIRDSENLIHPEHAVNPAQLLLGGDVSLRAHGLLVYADDKIYDYRKEHEGMDGYLDTILEQSARTYATIEDFEDLYAEDSPLAYLNSMKEMAESAIDRLVGNAPEPLQQYQRNVLSMRLDG